MPVPSEVDPHPTRAGELLELRIATRDTTRGKFSRWQRRHPAQPL